MRNRSCATLVLVGALPLALAGCDDSVNVTARKDFKTVQECVDAKVPVDVCSNAYMHALDDHRKIAPTYDDQAACDEDFVPGYCQVTSDGKYVPRLGGFELAMSGDVPRQAAEQARAQGDDGGNGLLTGLLLGQMLGGGGNRYYSEPIYDMRNRSGGYSTSTLSRQAGNGQTFSRSTQARSTGSYVPQTLGRSESIGSAVSRGGFGSSATARSGWGSSTRGGFSSGG